MQIKPPALVLAGGASSRMGCDKAQVILSGRSMIEHVTERLRPQVSMIVVNSNDVNAAALFAPYVAIADSSERPYGPLSGILTGMQHFASEGHSHFLTVSVDCPFLPDNLVPSLLEAVQTSTEVVIARSQDAMHPTIGLWPCQLYEELQAWLAATQRYAIKAFLDRCKTTYVDFQNQLIGTKEIDPFFNVNTRDDLHIAEELIAAR